MAKQKNDNQTQPLAAERLLLTERQVAEMTGLALSTLRHWRVRRVGPAFIKVGSERQGPVRYPLHDLMRWLERWRVETREEGR